MAWQRSGDTGATYPKLTATRGDKKADGRTINEIAGFLWRLSMQSGAHLTDYILDIGTVEMIGGLRTTELLRLAVKYGLLTKVKTPNGTGYKLIEDPDFIHLRSRAEVEWERQQRADTRDAALVVPVRLRDGDNCRWCGFGVVWPGTKTARSGEYDHLVPGAAGSVATMFVACRRCNRGRSGNVEDWDSSHELRPAPTRPRYSRATAKFLTDNGYPVEATGDDERPAPALGADTAPTSGVRPATGPSDDPAPAPSSTQSPAEFVESQRTVSDSRSAKSGLAGSGRDGDGSGLQGEGRAGSDPPRPTPPRRRGRRGARRKPSTGGEPR